MSDTTTEKPKEGWTYLHNSPKWHYFREGQSLCRRWWLPAWKTTKYEGDLNSPDNCKECARRRAKENETK